VVSLATTPDGQVIVAGTHDGARVITRAGKTLAHLTGHGHPVWAVAISPDARWVVTATGAGAESGESSDMSARVWDLQTDGALAWRAEIGNRGSTACFFPRADAFLVATTGGRIFRFRLDQPSPDHELACGLFLDDPDPTVRPRAHAGGIHEVVVSKDGRRAWSISNGPIARENELRAWDLETGLERYAVTGRLLTLGGLDLSPDETRLLTRSHGGLLELWETD
jgi:WD40 repeat protein